MFTIKSATGYSLTCYNKMKNLDYLISFVVKNVLEYIYGHTLLSLDKSKTVAQRPWMIIKDKIN